MILAGDLRPGMKIEVEGVPFVVTDYQWVKPGKRMIIFPEGIAEGKIQLPAYMK